MTILDRAHFDAMTGGDGDLQLEIIGLFRGQVSAWNQMLTPDANWRDAAHTVKGSARGIGLWPLAQACEAAEAARGAGELKLALQYVHACLDEALAVLDLAAQSRANT
jgi:HPt (histidine-containing phosphotransfer) domain-containing protein